MLYQTENLHGGDVYSHKICLDYSVNLNPLGTPPEVVMAIKEAATRSARYPDPYCRKLIKAIADMEGTDESCIICGNGGAELIYAYCDALRPEKPAVLCPSFSEYSRAAVRNGVQTMKYTLDEKTGFLPDEGILDFIRYQKPDLLFLCSPNNPDGRLIPDILLDRILEECKKTGCAVFLDECFLDLSEGYEQSRVRELERYPGLFILKAFTKNYAMAGIRLGYGLCADKELSGRIAERLQPWNVSVLAQEAGLAAAGLRDYTKQARQIIRTERLWLTEELTAAGLRVYPSDANYMLIKEPQALSSVTTLGQELLKKGILVRDCAGFEGLDKGWYRICVKQRKDNMALAGAVKEIMDRVKSDRISQ